MNIKNKLLKKIHINIKLEKIEKLKQKKIYAYNLMQKKLNNQKIFFF